MTHVLASPSGKPEPGAGTCSASGFAITRSTSQATNCASPNPTSGRSASGCGGDQAARTSRFEYCWLSALCWSWPRPEGMGHGRRLVTERFRCNGRRTAIGRLQTLSTGTPLPTPTQERHLVRRWPSHLRTRWSVGTSSLLGEFRCIFEARGVLNGSVNP